MGLGIRILITIVCNILLLYSSAQTSTEQEDGIVRIKLVDQAASAIQNSNQIQLGSSSGTVTLGITGIDNANRTCQAMVMKRVFPYAGKFEEKHRKYGLHLWYDVQYESTMTVESVLELYRNLSDVQAVEPIYKYTNSGKMTLELDADDPRFEEQWHYRNNGQTGGTSGADINLNDAWNFTTGNSSVIVSVHDSGFDTDHPDLQDVLWVNEGEIPGNNIDDDNNGFIDDVHGFNFWNLSSDIEDYNGHGTHVSGTIAARNDNGIGVSGIAGGSANSPGVKVMMCRLGDDNGSPYIFNPAPSFVYAADMGAVISQNSWGGGGYSQDIVDAINYFVNEAGGSSNVMEGGIVIISAGNSNNSSVDYRSHLENTMMVSALNHNDQKSWYSSYGTWVDIAAPGGETNFRTDQGVLSTLHGGGYAFYQGTSMACPHVSGVAALLLSYSPGMSNDELWDILISSVDSVDSVNPGYSGQLGSGRINALKAMQSVGPSSQGILKVLPERIDLLVEKGEDAVVNVKLQNTGDAALTYNVQETESWLEPERNTSKLLLPGELDSWGLTISNDELEDGFYYDSRIEFVYDNIETTQLPIRIYVVGDPAIASENQIEFDDTYAFYNDSIEFTLLNTGSDTLKISSIYTDTENFAASLEEASIENDGTLDLTVYFNPKVAGEIRDTLYFESNDPNNSVYKVVLRGTGILTDPPLLSVLESSIFVEQNSPGTLGSSVLTLTNEGDATLNYSLSTEVVSRSVNSTDAFGEDDLPIVEGYRWIDSDESNGPVYNWIEISDFADDSLNGTYQKRIVFDDFSFPYYGKEYNYIDISAYGYVHFNSYSSRYASLIPSTRGPDNLIAAFWRSSSFDNVESDIYSKEFEDKFIVQYHNMNGNTYQIVLYKSGEILIQYREMNNVGLYSLVGIENETGTEGILIDYHRYAEPAYVKNNHAVSIRPKSVITALNPYSGTIAAGSSQEISLNYDLTTINEGILHEEVIKITTNEIADSIKYVPFKAYVKGTPELSLSATTLDLGKSYLGDTLTSSPIIISNSGTDSLFVSLTRSGSSDFKFENQNLALGVGDSLAPIIEFIPSALGEKELTIALASNDPNRSSENLVLTYAVVGFPNISANTDSIFLTTPYGVPVTGSFDITNDDGEDTLNYRLRVLSAGDGSQGDRIQLGQNMIQDFDANGNAEVKLMPVLENIDATLKGRRIGYYARSYNYDVLASDIRSKGGSWEYVNVSELDEKLNTYFLDSYISRLNTAQLDQLAEWMEAGGNVMLGMRYKSSQLESFLGRFGLKSSYDYHFANVPLRDIEGHPITEGVNSVYTRSTSLGVSDESAMNLKTLVRFDDGDIMSLILPVGKGNLFLTVDETFSDSYLSREDNRIFAANALDYLSTNPEFELSVDRGELLINQSETIELNYTPIFQDEPGLYHYDLVFDNNSETNPFTVPLVAHVTAAPQLSILEDSVRFGEVFVGLTETVNFSVENTGIDTLRISEITFSNPILDAEEFDNAIAPGATGNLQVQFTSTDLVAISEYLVIHSNDPNTPEFKVGVAGTGISGPVLEVLEPVLYDTVDVGASPIANFMLSNIGLELLQYSIAVVSDESFPVTLSIESGEISAGQSQQIELTAAASTLPEGNYVASILVSSNDGRVDQQVQEIRYNLTIEGTPQISLEENIHFDDVTVGLSSEKELSILNLGNGSLYIDSIQFSSDDYSSIGQVNNLRVLPGASQNIRLSFDPSTIGVIESELSIYTDLGVNTVSLSGVGLAPGSIEISQDTLHVSVAADGQVETAFTLQNSSDNGLLNFYINGFRNGFDNFSDSSMLSGSDNFGYYFEDSRLGTGKVTYTWLELSDEASVVDLGDDASVKVELPFEFELYGIRYDEVFISSNGFVSFSEELSNTPINTPIPSFSAPNAIIAALWKDLDPSTGTISYEVSASELIVSYVDVSDANSAAKYSFQLVLNRSGSIRLSYLQVGNVADPTVGIESGSGVEGLQVVHDEAYLEDQVTISFFPPTSELSPSITEGQLANGEHVEIQLIVDATGLIGGEYVRTLSINSNDTLNPSKEIYVIMDVTGEPDLSLLTDNLVKDTAIVQGVASYQNVRLINEGSDELVVSSVEINSDDFVLLPRTHAVNDSVGYFSISHDIDRFVISGEFYPQSSYGEVNSIGLYHEDRVITTLRYSIDPTNDKILVPLQAVPEWQIDPKQLFNGQFVVKATLLGDDFIPLELTATLSPIMSIAAKDHANWLVAFTPTSAGDIVGDINILSNKADGAEVSFEVNGYGVNSTTDYEIDPTFISEELVVGDSTTGAIVIQNTGDDRLEYSMRLSRGSFTPASAATNNHLNIHTSETQVQNRFSEGVFFAAVHDYSKGAYTIGEFSLNNPENFNDIAPFDFSGYGFVDASEISLDGFSYLRLTSRNALVSTDLETGEEQLLRYVYPLISGNWTGMARDYSSGELYLCTQNSLYKMDEETLESELIGYINSVNLTSIAVDAEGNLFGIDTWRDNLVAIDKVTASVQIIGRLGISVGSSEGLAFDTRTNKMYMTSYNAFSDNTSINIVDTNTGTAEFLSDLGSEQIDGFYRIASIAFPPNTSSSVFELTQSSGIIETGASDTIGYVLRSNSLQDGTYNYKLNIASNSEVKPSHSIPVELTVTGNQPEIDVERTELIFNYTALGDSSFLQLPVSNEGGRFLRIDSVKFDNQHFGLVEATPIFLGARETSTLNVYFSPDSVTTFASSMVIYSNDEANSPLTIELLGSGISAYEGRFFSVGSVYHGVYNDQIIKDSLGMTNTLRDSANWYIYSSSMPEWFHVKDTAGDFSSREEEATFFYDIDANGLTQGRYAYDLEVLLNDGFNSELHILPIVFDVKNRTPYILDLGIPDVVAVTTNELSFDFSSSIDDPDGDEVSVSIVTSDSGVILPVYDSINQVDFEIQSYGQVTLTVTATDPFGGETIFEKDVFVNDVPTILKATTSDTIKLSDHLQYALDDYFQDLDHDLEYELKTISGDSHDASISTDGELKIIPGQVGAGEVLVIASDPYASDSLSFSYYVNSAPTLIEDIDIPTVINEGVSVLIEDVSSYFEDSDKDELTYSVTVSSTANLMATLESDNLKLEAISYGIVEMALSISDNQSETVDMEYSILINSVPRAIKETTTDTINLTEKLSYELSEYFEDSDQDLSYQIQTISGVSGEAFITSDGQLQIVPSREGAGEVKVLASDPYASDSLNFSYYVNHAPTQISDLEIPSAINEGVSVYVEEISSYFEDSDKDELTYSVMVSDESNLKATLKSDSLKLEAISHGSVELILSISDPKLETITTEYSILINSTPRAIRQTTIDTLNLTDNISYELSEYFEDLDHDLSYQIQTISGAVGDAFITSEGQLQIVPSQEGAGEVKVIASDPYASDALNFNYYVNHAPTQVAELEIPSVINVGTSVIIQEISNYFEDKDADALTYSVSSSDDTKLRAVMESDQLELDGLAYGEVLVNMSVSDQFGETTSRSYQVSINAIPYAVHELRDTTIDNHEVIQIELSDYYTDDDGDALNYTVSIDGAKSVGILDGSLLMIELEEDGVYTAIVTVTDGKSSFIDEFKLTREVILSTIRTDEEGFNIFPNPVADYLNIHFDRPIVQEGIISIFNLDGKKVMVSKLDGSGINVSDLPKGQYMIIIEMEEELIRKKFIKE